MNIKERPVWNNFIAIEGIDGAGNTTQRKLLTQALSAADFHMDSGCEPTDGPIGRLIRDALAGRTPVTPDTMALLFAADRKEHIYGPQGIEETLQAGGLYITDRYIFSSLAYQGLSSDQHWVDRLNAPYPLPGCLIFLALPAKEAMARISGRKERDIFENTPFQEKVAEGYKTAIDNYRGSGMDILELDSSESPERLCSRTLHFLKESANITLNLP